MDTGNVHGVMIRAAFSDFSEGVRLRITGEAPPAADLIWGPITAFVAGGEPPCTSSDVPRSEPAPRAVGHGHGHLSRETTFAFGS